MWYWMASMAGTAPMKRPPGFRDGADGLEGAVDQARVGHDEGIDGHGQVEAAALIVELVHGALEEGDLAGVGSQACPGLFEHAGGEVEGDDLAELAAQDGDERAGAAAQVDGGLAGGHGSIFDRLADRIDDIRTEGVEEDVVITACVSAPVSVLVALFGFRHRGRTHSGKDRFSKAASSFRLRSGEPARDGGRCGGSTCWR